MKTTVKAKQQKVIPLLLVTVYYSLALVSADCSEMLPTQYVNEGTQVTLAFSVNMSTVFMNKTLATITIELGKFTVMTVFYRKTSLGEVTSYVDESVVEFIGDEKTGNLSFKITEVDETKAGVYRLRHALMSDDLQCLTLYILRKPSTPSISKQSQSDPELSGNVIFSCNSLSTTEPDDHSLDMIYTWTYNNVTNPAENRFTYGERRQTMKISAIKKADQGSVVKCSAKEDIGLGLMSNSSRSILINVLYGPENMTFNPSTTAYTFHIGDSMDIVVCQADCNPNCNFSWAKENKIFGEQTLSLESIEVSEAGTYTCTATRMTVHKSEDLHVDVIHGPSSIRLDPNFTSYRKKEKEVLRDITCFADCWPVCDYEWTGPGLSTLGAVLSLGSLNRGEHGRYTCTATNQNLSVSSSTSVLIEVIYGPDMVILSPSETNITVNEEQSINDRNCSASCFPSCMYVWRKPDKSSASSTGGILEFRNNIDRKDAGIYGCSALNPEYAGHNKSVALTINVRYGPDQVSLFPSTHNYTKNVGSVLNTITCISVCYPVCTYSWVNDDGKDISYTDTLKLGSLDTQEMGQYVCTASNPETTGSASITVTVNVRFGPDTVNFDPDVSNHTVEEGRHLPNIICFAECYPGCSQKWVNVSDSKTTLNESEGLLTFGEASRFYTGEYKCTSRNIAMEYPHSSYKSVYVIVQYMPDVAVRLEKEQNITFVCTATGEPAQYIFASWVHIAPDKVTAIQEYNGSTSGNQNRLVLQALSYMDSGTYRCSVTNMVADYKTGQLYAANEIDFTKTGEPQILSTGFRASAPISGDTKLSTSFYSNDDNRKLAVSWFKVDNDSIEEIRNDSRKFSFDISETNVTVFFYSKEVELLGFETQLTIQNITKEELGSYQVRITNSVGHNSTTFIVLPEGPPETPKNFRVLPAVSTSSSVTLTWHAGFFGGANQTFYVEYRKKGSLEWLSGPDVFGGKVENKRFSVTVKSLSGDTPYEFRIYAGNKFNRSDVTVTEGNTTAVQQAEDQAASSNVGLIAGGATGGVVLAAIIVVLVLLFLRRRKEFLKSPKKRLLKDKDRPVGTDGADDTPEINLNPMYESAGPLPSTSNNSGVYSQVDKNRKKSTPVGAIYSHVDKPKKRQNSDVSEGKNDVYAQVQKKTHRETDEGKTKAKKQKPDKKTKRGKKTEGDIYDNVDIINSTVTKGDTVYENPSCSIEDEQPKQMRNQDGLVYAILDLPKENVGKDRKAVIHGLDDRTDYADIKYGEVGEQAPESDEEKTKEN